ncbi:hypothetical protein [Gelidibacter salicanalis]|uniref:T9SS C-terminal target domain-containing protein n=1 Tax=Gelidibacter salicanalis TaxID=291193 RepID=A0A934KUA4_9FLAO|nr:hypothetical protein [Gelidibacter salicanalis]MBJ7880893.1 hypothetical protein [Gelidibacter salicanalis]
MKKFYYLAISILALNFATSCADNDVISNDDDGGETGDIITKTGILTADETWTANNIYVLSGKVVVDEGVTLTINKGTIIKGAEGQLSLASALVIDQGGKLMAEGTAQEPIIFTSILDDIQVGQTRGSNLTMANSGLWGGVIVLGKAPISVSGDIQTNRIEGLPATESYGEYGGNVSNDNSGVLKYISIRHGGISIATDNEINGLTLGGVGSSTVIDNIEVVANQDDSIEWFGGTVNVSNVLTYGQGDDGLDADEAWSGTINNALVILGADSDSALELDGPAGSSATEGGYTIQNVTIIGDAGGTSKYADLRDGLIANMNNILAYGFSATATVKVNGADSQTELTNGRIAFSKWEIVLPSGVTLPSIITGALPGDEAKFLNNATAIASPSVATVGANTTVFSWTYAAYLNAF